ncbi:hypothetical protein [Caballeronia sp. LZ035]|uniref:hypothetical protein n=1 Tax=Caballeronia sp. LZ035 TaxID=3038568 RepID=UPI00285D85BE|nr:hypothetical protein [Caballeronia sp. LZ035]MDR5756483.1 hypothetical protein [Caballeronia sp. LZ035]
MTYEEQRAARRALKKCGVLIETEKRLEHKIYFRIDEDVLERLVEEGQASQVEQSAEWENPISRNGKSPFREMDFSQPAERSNPCPRTGRTLARGEGFDQVVNGVKTTAEITAESSSNACAREPVDNFDAAAAASLRADSSKRELELTDLLVALEAARRKRCQVDRSRDRTQVLAWVGRGVSTEQLREAHRRAAAARERDADSRAVNVGFLARFVDEVLAETPGKQQCAEHAQWWLSGETDVCSEGARLGVRAKRPDESLPEYRVLVAKAAGKGPWIDHVLRDAKRSGSERFYQNVIDTFGDALLPTDFYA